MVLSIICLCLGIIQFSLGVVAASNDQPSNRHDIVSNQYAAQLLDYDIYSLQNSPLTYVCAGQNYGLSWVSN